MASRLRAVFVAIALFFGAVVYMVALTPTIENLMEVFLNTGGVSGEREEQLLTTETIALRVVPLMLGLGALIYLYVAMAKEQRYRGGGRY